jgi:hypothetical protein
MRCIRLLLPSDLSLLSLTVIFDEDHHDLSHSIQKAEMLDENLLGEATSEERASFHSAKRSSIPAVTSAESYYSVGEDCCDGLTVRLPVWLCSVDVSVDCIVFQERASG